MMILKYLKLYQSSCNARYRAEDENDINFKLTKYPLRPLAKNETFTCKSPVFTLSICAKFRTSKLSKAENILT